VSTAFQEGGAIAGSLALVLEAAKGITAVLLARYYFPADPTWEIVALIALVMGRYWSAQAVGTTSVIWGSIVHAPITAGLTYLISFLGFTIFREKRQGRLLVLVLFPLITLLRYAPGPQFVAMACLCGLIAWIYQKVPEDLEIPTAATRLESQRLFGLFRRDRALQSLDQPLSRARWGSKAAILSQLTAWGYPVPKGYVLPAGDDPAALIEITRPSVQTPVIVRAAAVGDQPLQASAAGQYPAIPNLTSQEALFAAINQCFRSYDRPSASQYRRDRGLPETQLAVIVQQQVAALCGGVACSRDPLTGQGDIVVIEGLLGSPQAVVSGQKTPEHYRVAMPASDLPANLSADSWQIPAALSLTVQGTGDLPPRLIEQVAYLARHLEAQYQGLPQILEWSYDGEHLWVLQSRPLLPPAGDRVGTVPSLLAGTQIHRSGLSAPGKTLQGWGISPGQVIGTICHGQPGPAGPAIGPDSILWLPSLPAAQIPLWATAGGFIATAGGQLSHGAIVAREYGIPTITNLAAHPPSLQPGTRVKLDGTSGTVEIL
jgi:pyruvate,water dikinase